MECGIEKIFFWFRIAEPAGLKVNNAGRRLAQLSPPGVCGPRRGHNLLLGPVCDSKGNGEVNTARRLRRCHLAQSYI
ncbi:hypothetical protein J6590_095013, partial [Homalodisca vitripennis]